MTIVLMKQQGLSEMSTQLADKKSRWLMFLKNRFLFKSSLHQQWDSFRSTPGGRHVPYRIWLRHGAYIQLNQQEMEIDTCPME